MTAQAMTNVGTPVSESFEPKIVGFLCNWCSYAGADKAGSSQTPYPPNVAVIRVMCSGRVDPQFILDAFHKGADGVMILACHPGDCHYRDCLSSLESKRNGANSTTSPLAREKSSSASSPKW